MSENRGLTMREILFRGKWKNSGEWVYGNLFNPDKADTPTQICIGTYIAKTCYEIDPETVGQFTGLTDKNGVRIFEGDIIQSLKSSVTWLVQWFPEHSAFMVWCKSANEVGFLYEFADITKVIGNIFDNPEL